MRLFVNTTVSLNAMAKIPQDIHLHEVPVLQVLFGEENVSVSEPYEVDLPALEHVNEYGRMIVKYGADAVDKVYRSYQSDEFKAAIAKTDNGKNRKG